MSLINEALKKAQRQRHDDPAGVGAAVTGSGGNIAKRGAPRSAKTLLLLTAGAIVLVVCSVVFTVYLVNRPAPPAPVPVTKKPPEPKAAPIVPAVTPVQDAVAVKLPSTAPAPKVENPPPHAPPPAAAKIEPAATPIVAKPKQAPVVSSTPSPTPAVVPVSAPAPAQPVKPVIPEVVADARIQAFVDTMRIAGVKAAGADSRVLLNDRVYRLNDIVDRALSVRLIKVEGNSLTFSDAAGFTYVKYF